MSYINDPDKGVTLVRRGDRYTLPYSEFIVPKVAGVKDLPLEGVSVGSTAYCIESQLFYMFDGIAWQVQGA